ncbi:Uncharacterised protein [Mycobacteroides abscessus subsp. abscessus]|nr:Uncharacterised protein [Mycobacteroides abscessus subsp. abscessus]
MREGEQLRLRLSPISNHGLVVARVDLLGNLISPGTVFLRDHVYELHRFLFFR